MWGAWISSKNFYRSANSINKNACSISRNTTSNNKKAITIEKSSKNKNTKTPTTSKRTSTALGRNPESSGRTTAISATTKTRPTTAATTTARRNAQHLRKSDNYAYTTKTYSTIIATNLHSDLKSSNTKYLHEFRDKAVVNFIDNFFFIDYFCFVVFVINSTFFVVKWSGKFATKCSAIVLVVLSGSKVKVIFKLLIRSSVPSLSIEWISDINSISQIVWIWENFLHNLFNKKVKRWSWFNVLLF